MPYSVKGFFEIDEDMVQILLVLEVLFTQDSEVEDLFCGASSRSEPSQYFLGKKDVHVHYMLIVILKYLSVHPLNVLNAVCLFYLHVF